MPTTICPNPECGRKLRLPSGYAGKHLKCPLCGKSFALPAEALAPEEEEPPPRPKKRRPAGKDQEAVRESPPRPAREKEEDEEEADQERRPRPSKVEEPDEEPRRKRRRKRRRRPAEKNYDALHAQAGWRNVSRGFLMCIIAIWMWIGEFVLGIVGILLIGSVGLAMLASSAGLPGAGAPGGAAAPGGAVRPDDADAPDNDEAPGDAADGKGDSGRLGTAVATLAGMGIGLVLLFVFVNLLSFLASILNLVGQLFCTAIPTDEGNIKILAIMTFGLSATAALVTWVWQIIGLVSSHFEGSIWMALPMSGGGGWIGLIVDIMQLIADICWFRLLYGIALEAHNERLASQINLFLITCLGLAFGSCLLVPCSAFLVFKLLPDQPGIAVGVMMGLIVLVLLGLVAWYIVILYRVRGSVLKLLRRAEKGVLREA